MTDINILLYLYFININCVSQMTNKYIEAKIMNKKVILIKVPYEILQVLRFVNVFTFLYINRAYSSGIK